MAADSAGATLRIPRDRGSHRHDSVPVRCRSFHHEAVLYEGGAEGFVEFASPLIEQALELESPVLVAVGAERITGLREALGAAAEQVGFADMRELVTNPARHSHPFLTEASMGEGVSNTDYPTRQDPDWPFDGGLPPPGAPAQVMRFGAEDLGELRHFLARWAGEQTLAPVPTEELVLAVNEITTNSVLHGGGKGTLGVWREHDVLLCEVRDRGHIRDPLLGRVEPDGLASTSRGLWIANRFCELVQIRSSPMGSVVRLHKRLG
jgi:anti-sigma regulatory factor (Ser/Thr protein kinase)